MKKVLLLTAALTTDSTAPVRDAVRVRRRVVRLPEAHHEALRASCRHATSWWDWSGDLPLGKEAEWLLVQQPGAGTNFIDAGLAPPEFRWRGTGANANSVAEWAVLSHGGSCVPLLFWAHNSGLPMVDGRSPDARLPRCSGAAPGGVVGGGSIGRRCAGYRLRF